MFISNIKKVRLSGHLHFYSITVNTDDGSVVSIPHFNNGTAGRSEIFFTSSGLRCVLHVLEGEFALFPMVELDQKKVEDFSSLPIDKA